MFPKWHLSQDIGLAGEAKSSVSGSGGGYEMRASLEKWS